jgi:hypothetical protein
MEDKSWPKNSRLSSLVGIITSQEGSAMKAEEEGLTDRINKKI